jgi:hypothetical protein
MMITTMQRRLRSHLPFQAVVVLLIHVVVATPFWQAHCFVVEQHHQHHYPTLAQLSRTSRGGNKNDWCLFTKVWPDDAHVLRILDSATVMDPRNGKSCNALEGLCIRDMSTNNGNSSKNGKTDKNNNNPLASLFFGQKKKQPASDYVLVVVMPQLGDFDSAEYAELLAAVRPHLDDAK